MISLHVVSYEFFSIVRFLKEMISLFVSWHEQLLLAPFTFAIEGVRVDREITASLVLRLWPFCMSTTQKCYVLVHVLTCYGYWTHKFYMYFVVIVVILKRMKSVVYCNDYLMHVYAYAYKSTFWHSGQAHKRSVPLFVLDVTIQKMKFFPYLVYANRPVVVISGCHMSRFISIKHITKIKSILRNITSINYCYKYYTFSWRITNNKRGTRYM